MSQVLPIGAGESRRTTAAEPSNNKINAVNLEALMPTITIRATASIIALLAGVTFAHAQTAPDHGAHHPGGQVQGATPMPPMGGKPGSMEMGKMMEGDMMRQMMNRMMARDGDRMAMMPAHHIEGHIAYLKAELGITDAQLPTWNAFADTMRQSANAMRSAMTGSTMPTTAPERLDAMIAMMSARLDSLKSIAAAEKALYAELTDAQKKSADDLIMERMEGSEMRH